VRAVLCSRNRHKARELERLLPGWTIEPLERLDAVPLKRDGLQGVKVPGMLILFRNQKPTDGTAGGSIDPKTAQQLLSALEQYRPAVQGQLKKFCK